jgi:hypothetical protein
MEADPRPRSHALDNALERISAPMSRVLLKNGRGANWRTNFVSTLNFRAGEMLIRTRTNCTDFAPLFVPVHAVFCRLEAKRSNSGDDEKLKKRLFFSDLDGGRYWD